MGRLAEIEVSRISVEDSIRTNLDEDSLKELASSIERHGVLQPITVQPRQDGTYIVLMGERRFTAAKRAGLDVVPVIVMEKNLKTEESLEARLIENLHRKALDPLDEAEAYQQLIDMGYSVSEVARRVGKSRYYVSKRLRLLRLHPRLRQEVRRRTLKPGHAQALLRLEPQQQLTLALEIMDTALNEKETRAKVREILGRELSWHLIPVRLSIEEYESLEKIAPKGDVETFIRQSIEMLVREASSSSPD